MMKQTIVVAPATYRVGKQSSRSTMLDMQSVSDTVSDAQHALQANEKRCTFSLLFVASITQIVFCVVALIVCVHFISSSQTTITQLNNDNAQLTIDTIALQLNQQFGYVLHTSRSLRSIVSSNLMPTSNLRTVVQYFLDRLQLLPGLTLRYVTMGIGYAELTTVNDVYIAAITASCNVSAYIGYPITTAESELYNTPRCVSTYNTEYRFDLDDYGGVSSTPVSVSSALSSYAWYSTITNSSTEIWGKPYIAPITQQRSVYNVFQLPCEGPVCGAIVVETPLSWLLALLQQQISGMESAVSFVMDADGNLLCSSSGEQCASNTTLAASKSADPAIQQAAVSVLGSGVRTWSASINVGDSVYDLNSQQYTYINSPLFIVILQPSAQRTHTVHTSMKSALPVAICMVLLGVALFTATFILLWRPIASFGSKLKLLAEFNFSHMPLARTQNKVRLCNRWFSELLLCENLQHSYSVLFHSMESFCKFTPPQVLRGIVRHGGVTGLGMKKKKVCILFTDVQGFTRMVEQMEGTEVVDIMADYFSTMTEVIQQHSGCVDKYIGDAIMALWGATDTTAYPSVHAARAAVAMWCSLRSYLHPMWDDEGRPMLTFRAGLHTGFAHVGIFGCDQHLTYTAMGDVVNTASRIEQLNKEMRTLILCSDRVIEDIAQQALECQPTEHTESVLFDLDHRKLGVFKLKGKDRDTVIHEIYNRDLSQNERKLARVFCDAVAAFELKQWDKASALFEEYLLYYPTDIPASRWLKQVQEKSLPEWLF